MCSLVGSGVDTRAYVAPGTAVQRFLLQQIQIKTKLACAIYVTNLTPEEISMRVLVEVCSDLSKTLGVELDHRKSRVQRTRS
jgi:hypothetical protein